MRRPTLAIVVLLTIALGGICTSAPATPDRYSKVRARVSKLEGAPNARVMQVGTSTKGRPIYSILITSPDDHSAIASERVRVLVLCGQHGNEPSAVGAMLDLADELASTSDPSRLDLLGKTVLAVVPAVNPDGLASYRRTNASGVDLNRNWRSPDQPETLAVEWLVEALRPHVIVDQHEWLDGDQVSEDSVEVPSFGTARQYTLTRMLARTATKSMPTDGIRLSVTTYRAQTDSSLAHRAFARKGICSMLLETTQDWSPGARTRAYKDFTMSLLTALADPPGVPIETALAATLKAEGPADPVIAQLYEPAETAPALPVPVSCAASIFLVMCYVTIRYAGGRNRTLARPESVVQARRLSLTDALKLAGPPRMKAALIRQHRSRPTDRTTDSDTRRPSRPAYARRSSIHRQTALV